MMTSKMKFAMKSRFAALLLICSAFLVMIAFPALVEEPEDNRQLIYCAGSHAAIAQNQMADFAVDYMLAKDGSLRISLFQDEIKGAALRVWTVQRKANRPSSFIWDGKVDNKLVEPGRYILNFVTRDRQEERAAVSFEITAPRAPLPLEITKAGDYLPEQIDTQGVWQAMMAPMAVVDEGDLSHTPITDSPGGKMIGHVHGQTAGLIILDLLSDGYARVGAWATDDGSYIEGYIRQDKLKMIEPHPGWGLLIDKVAQKMYVYQADDTVWEGARLLGTLDVSTGLMTRNKLFRETRAGAFITQKRIASFDSEGHRYDFAIRIDGGNLMHEVGHRLVSGSKDFTSQLPELGKKASNGCVRITPIPDSKGMNAEWLWRRLPRNTKVLVLDDPQARAVRLQELGASIPGTPGDQPDEAAPIVMENPFIVTNEASGAAVPQASEVSPAQADQQPLQAAPPLAGRDRITMTFTGDCVLGSEEKSRKLPESFDRFIADKGYDWPFSGVYEVLSADDLSIINLEGVLKDDTRNKAEQKLHWFRGPTEFAGILPAGNIEIAGLANNHMRDYGIAGHNSTRQALEGAGIPYFGYGDTYIHEHQGLKIGFGGIRETTYRQKPALPGEEIRALREAGCDFIVYTIHAGQEYAAQHNDLQAKIAHAIIDAGADLIIGMHPHVVQGIEEYKGRLIVYSLGNFTFGGNLKLKTFDGMMAQVLLDFEGRELKETTLRLLPVLTTGTLPDNDFRPILAVGEDKERILQLVQDDSPDLTIREIMSFSR